MTLQVSAQETTIKPTSAFRVSSAPSAFDGPLAIPPNIVVILLDSPRDYVNAIDPATWSESADSSSSVPTIRNVQRRARLGSSDMSTAEQIALLVHTLGFNKSQLGKVFRVSRQSIYDWLKGANVKENNLRRLTELAGLVQEMAPGKQRPLYHRFTTSPIKEGEPSLLDLLLAEQWDQDRIRSHLSHARELTAKRDELRNRVRHAIHRLQDDGTLMDNLASLG